MTHPDFDDEAFDETAAVEVEDLDVEMDDTAEDEAEDSVEAPAAAGDKPAKAPKEPKAPARPPVAEGYITPVAFAKVLTEHLAARGAKNKHGVISKENPVPPQMVYSYMRNNSGGKNPIPVYTDPAVTGSRVAVLKTEEALAWWDEKDERINASKTAKAEKEKAKAEKAAEAAKTAEASTEVESPEAVGEVEEAE